MSACLAACNNIQECVAIEYNITSGLGQCWMHISPSDLNQKIATPGLIQYIVLVRCNGKQTLNEKLAIKQTYESVYELHNTEINKTEF